MVVKIGENIKTLRKEHGITQERLAEFLGISPQAVSRWESEVCYPDLELIPALSAFFGVSSDRLLGLDFSENEQMETGKKVAQLMLEGRREEALAMARQNLALYPGNYGLAVQMVSLLFQQAAGKGNAEEYLAEPIALCRRILRDCPGGTDETDFFRLSARMFLIRLLVQAEKHAEAFGLAMAMPSAGMSREALLPLAVTGEAREQQVTSALHGMIPMLNGLPHLMRYEGKAPGIWAYSSADCRQSMAVYDAVFAWHNKKAGEKAKQSSWVYLGLCLRMAKAILEENADDEQAKGEAEQYFAKAVSCLPFVDGPDAEAFNNTLRMKIIEEDPHAQPGTDSYAGKNSGYVLLHAYAENGYLENLANRPAYEKTLAALRAYAENGKGEFLSGAYLYTKEVNKASVYEK